MLDVISVITDKRNVGILEDIFIDHVRVYCLKSSPESLLVNTSGSDVL